MVLMDNSKHKPSYLQFESNHSINLYPNFVYKITYRRTHILPNNCISRVRAQSKVSCIRTDINLYINLNLCYQFFADKLTWKRFNFVSRGRFGITVLKRLPLNIVLIYTVYHCSHNLACACMQGIFARARAQLSAAMPSARDDRVFCIQGIL